jgi:hypothetical protein
MATTSAGNPYVESSDLVANYPATSLALANRLDKYAVNPFADAAARDAAIPTPVQGQLAQTLDDNKVWRYDGTAWAPFSSAGPANFTDTATGTYTDGTGQAWKFLTFTGTSTVNIDTAGFCDLLICAGGGGGGAGYASGAGAGALLYVVDAYLPVANHPVIVGAGGAGRIITYQPTMGVHGNASRLADYIAPGGAGGVPRIYDGSGWVVADGSDGGSGSGASAGNTGATRTGSGGSGLVGVGGDGGLVSSTIVQAAGGGGGAASGVLGRGESPTISGYGGAGASGRVISIRGTSVDLCAGGGGSGLSAGGAGGSGIGGVGVTGSTGGAASPNTGSGGGAAYDLSNGSVGGNGGSGTVTIRVKV